MNASTCIPSSNLSEFSAANRSFLEAEPRLIHNASDWVGAIWSTDRLLSAYGDRSVQVSDTQHQDEPLETRLDVFIEYCKSVVPEVPLYLHWWFGPVAPELFAALDQPWYVRSLLDRLPAELDPQLCWYLAGPKGSGTKWHTDMLATTAWCQLLDGEKQWWFERPAGTARAGTVFEIIQTPGTMVYVPSGWRHRVANRKPSFALAGNLVNDINLDAVRHALAHSPRWQHILNRLEEVSR